MTSYEAWYNRKPLGDHLKIFGSLCYHQIPENYKDKLDHRSVTRVFIGYSEQSKGYRVYLVKSKKIIVFRNVIFDEDFKWS